MSIRHFSTIPRHVIDLDDEDMSDDEDTPVMTSLGVTLSDLTPKAQQEVTPQKPEDATAANTAKAPSEAPKASATTETCVADAATATDQKEEEEKY
jgi:BRCT domain type II-containing protein